MAHSITTQYNFWFPHLFKRIKDRHSSVEYTPFQPSLFLSHRTREVLVLVLSVPRKFIYLITGVIYLNLFTLDWKFSKVLNRYSDGWTIYWATLIINGLNLNRLMAHSIITQYNFWFPQTDLFKKIADRYSSVWVYPSNHLSSYRTTREVLVLALSVPWKFIYLITGVIYLTLFTRDWKFSKVLNRYSDGWYIYWATLR